MPGALSLGSIDIFRLSSRKSAMTLRRLNPENDNPDGSALALQYWPETLNDTSSVNYAKKAIPGGSLPLYQWINNGEHTVTFQAIFTTDVDVTKWADTQPASDVDAGYLAELKSKGLSKRNIDIRAALIWLRSFRMPIYKTDGSYLPPPKCHLTIPGSRFGLWTGETGAGNDPDSMYCLMTQCDIEVRASFPNGVPRIAAVSLGFEETPQLKGVVNFPGYGLNIAGTFPAGNGATNVDGSQLGSTAGAVGPKGIGVYGLAK